MNEDGLQPVRIAEQGEPAWSADGTKIAFEKCWSAQPFQTRRDIFVVNADGTGEVNLTGDSMYGSHEPSWSPDGQKIAFSRSGPTTNEIWVMDSTGANPIQLTSSSQGVTNEHPSWAPDGRKIIFASNRDSPYDRLSPHVMNADGSGPIVRLSTYIDGHPDPDCARCVRFDAP